ncbi:short-chain dehydrogenase [Burkholderia sp. ABCPW 14]|uniref:oxidoreductase n=1 Tax=Burkholderia sp. ABCPW 14 TaxID=1637860 RepID=UPI000770DBE3|nr:oxidoreductase [Burkholderia sp. ABCPW 14]KVD87256.1 short-chain dehydrogenase [Burkholderia sp. ABCPW 14]
MHAWSAQHVLPQGGKVAVVTGANSGLGWQIAETLAAKGAQVVMGCRDSAKGELAAHTIRTRYPRARIEVESLDLADLASVCRFADAVTDRHGRVDILCNNAGVMFLPLRHTRDGFEMQMGTNHLGHFALTGLLLPALRASHRARVVTMSSGFNRLGKIRLDNMLAEHGYNKYRAYCDSKLANLMFTLELQRRFDLAGLSILSVAAHPGYAATNLQFAGPTMENSPFGSFAMRLSNRFVAQPAEVGALPAIHAATTADVEGGAYIGPARLCETRGYPADARIPHQARDVQVGARLWEKSEQLTGVRYLDTPSPGSRRGPSRYDATFRAL